MDANKGPFPATRLGRFLETSVAGESLRAYLPPPLPPDPPINLAALANRLSEADRDLGRLDGITRLLPDKALFLYMYVRKEAVLSSQIEGTQSTLTDLLRFETEATLGQPVDDIREVSNYVDALMHGLERLNDFPLSLRLIREMHQRLLREGRGADKQAGEFRRSQNWIGGTRPGNALYVPPPPHQVMPCLDALERFIHEDSPGLPPLIKAGLIHVQFESIHPFLDGNGRLGRLLITLYLCMQRVQTQPLLYLSLYLKTHRSTYYRLLQDVREKGDWEAWLGFFLEGVASVANQAFQTTDRIVALFHEDRARISASGDRASSSLRLHEQFQKHAFLTAPRARASGLSMPTINAALAELEKLQIVREITGRKRGRVFAYTRYLELLGEEAPA